MRPSPLLSATSPAPWLVVCGVLICALLSATPAAAATFIAASGSFAQTSFVQSNVRTMGGVTLFDFTEGDTLSGTFSGTSVIQGSCVARRSGVTVCQAFETFTGTVDGQTGTVVFHDVFTIQATGSAEGSFTIVSGGSLSTVHGHGTFQSAGTSGTYSGVLIVAP